MAAPAGAITNGQPDGGRHPNVGAAAHCGFLGTAVEVTFDETYTPASTTFTGTCHAHPAFRPGTNAQGQNSNDIAVVVLDAPVPGIAPARLPTAGLLDQMKADGTLTRATQFTSVGYGDSAFVNGPGGQTTTHLQARHFAVGAFNSLTAAFLHLTQNAGNGGTCDGDSGGPNFLGAGAGETSIVAGVTVTGDTHCKSTNVDLRLDTPAARDFLDGYVTLP